MRAYPRQIERLFRQGTVTGLDEGQLLEAFVSRRDELAFEVIVKRHGPMVLGVCRQLLRDPNDVDDAFQATFLVLARKAGSLRQSELLGNWLYGVAYRVASRARSLDARRESRYCSLGQVDPREIEAVESAESERTSKAWLHEEVNRLPEKYRMPIILCYFEGLTHEEASDRLRWPLGTFKGRLRHAKVMLRRQLGGRGVDSSEQDLTNRLEKDAMGSVVLPQLLLTKTIRSSLAFAGKDIGTLAGSVAVSQSIIDLVQGASKAMTFSQIRAWALPGVLGLGAALTGASVIAFQGGPAKPDQIVDTPKARQPAPEALPSPKTSAEKPNPMGDVAPKPAASSPPAVRAPQSTVAGKPSEKPRKAARGDEDEPLWGTDRSGQGGIMRSFNAQLMKKVAQADPEEKSKATTKTLEEPVAMLFSNATPLEDVLKYIQAATSSERSIGLQIYVDPRGLEDVNETLQSTVVINVQGPPLRTTLHFILKQLHLAYCVRDGVVVISSVPGIKQELEQLCAELEIPVPEFVRPGFKAAMQLPAGVDPQKQK